MSFVDEELGRYTLLLIEDFLKRNGMETTLASFRDEKKAVIEQDEEEDMRVWLDVGDMLDLNRKYANEDGSVLEQLVNHQKRGYNPLTKPIVKTLKLANTSLVPLTSGLDTDLTQDGSKDTAYSLSLSSIHSSSSSQHPPEGEKKEIDPLLVKRGKKARERRKKLASSLEQASKAETKANRPSSTAPFSIPSAHPFLSANYHMRRTTDTADTNDTSGTSTPQSPLKTSNENWIPEGKRFAMLQRSIDVVNTNWNDTVLCRDLMRREMRKAEMDELRMKKQLDAESDSLSLTMIKDNSLPIRGECGLCGVSPLELVLEVSFKSIDDVRSYWFYNNTYIYKTNSKTGSSHLLENQRSGEGEDDEDEEEEDEDQLLLSNPFFNLSSSTNSHYSFFANSGKKGKEASRTSSMQIQAIEAHPLFQDYMQRYPPKRVPRCYDGTGVCVMCAQFFNQIEAYRPSREEIRQKQKLERSYKKVQDLAQKTNPLLSLQAYKRNQKKLAKEYERKKMMIEKELDDLSTFSMEEQGEEAKA